MRERGSGPAGYEFLETVRLAFESKLQSLRQYNIYRFSRNTLMTLCTDTRDVRKFYQRLRGLETVTSPHWLCTGDPRKVLSHFSKV